MDPRSSYSTSMTSARKEIDAPDKIKDSDFVPQEQQIRMRFHERDKGQIGP